VTNQVKIIGI